MIYGKQIVRAHMDTFSPFGRISLSIAVQDGDVFSVAKPLTLEKIDPQTYTAEPTVSLQREAAQELMDELWRVGIRPSEGSGSAGSLAATERHLADMRAIAFNGLSVEPPKK